MVHKKFMVLLNLRSAMYYITHWDLSLYALTGSKTQEYSECFMLRFSYKSNNQVNSIKTFDEKLFYC